MIILYRLLSMNFRRTVTALMLLTAAGCAGVSAPKPDSNGSIVPVLSTPKPEHGKTLSWEATMIKFLKEAAIYEANGDLGNAVEYVKIALTIDPSSPTARGELNRLILKRNSEAEKYFNAGKAARTSNDKEATRLFIAALGIRHDYPEALASLRELHIAKEEAVLQARLKKEAAKIHGKASAEDEDIDVANYSLEVAILSFEEGEYMTAIREFEKIKSRYPKDEDITLYLNSSYYNMGISWFSKNDSRKALSWFTKVDKGFERVDDFIKKCRENLRGSTEEIFRNGLKYYKNNNYIDAAEEWKSVLEIDPSHKQAKKYLRQVNKRLKASRNKSR
ncbi:MAG: hypothetical protein PHF56_15550 [Desulfuromonadaceae bacterium]|nr:hypothetical protein [Desulfuromonadaceae bacterium]